MIVVGALVGNRCTRSGGCTFVHPHEVTQTFASLRTIIGIPSWAIAAFHGSRRVDAFAFAVAAAVVFQALVHL